MTHVPPPGTKAPRRRRTSDTDVPIGGIANPSPPGAGPPAGEALGPGPRSIAGLDAALPLTMFPVRIATRLHRPDPARPPTALWIRIFPDVIHADGHIRELTRQELTVGQAYWKRLWRAAGDPQRREDAHRWIVSQLGAARSAWVSLRTTPVNPGDAPKQAVPDDQPLPHVPEFDPRRPRAETRPTIARMLPDVWHVTVRHGIEFVSRAWSSPVRRDLVMAPSLADIPTGGGVRDLLQQQRLWWMVDFDAAVEAGMALRMPWNPPAGGPRFATEVIVFGVRGDNTGADVELTELLDAHRFTSALELVAPGTPTNNTDSATAGFTETPADLEAYLARQTGPLSTERAPLTPQLPVPLGKDSAASAVTRALGLSEVNAFGRAEHALLRSGAWASDMNRSVWPATLDYLFSHALATGGVAALAAADRAWLAAWCRDWVRGGGFLPSFRVGSQPYGVFPVARRPARASLGDTQLDQLRGVLLDLWDDWFTSIGNVASFSNVRGGRWGDPPPTPEEEAVRLAAVLGAVPHPTAFRLRPATVRRDEITSSWKAGIVDLEALLLESHNQLRHELYDLTWKGDINDGTLSEQSYGLERLRAFADQMLSEPFYNQYQAATTTVRDHIDGVLRPMTAAHAIRAETRDWEQRFSNAHLPTSKDPPLWYVEFGEDGADSDGTFPALRLVPDRSPAAVAASLRELASDARRTGSIPRPRYAASKGRSLLEKLIEFGVMNVDPQHAEELARGLEGLAGLLESGAVADPLGELTRLLRESLGLATHRLDAWLSSLANQQLAALRSKRPSGLQVAGYGWVVNLEPDEAGDADSQGFIHAPSLDHAATAAVLRSAWLNYASHASDAPFAVDLSSERVRRALWLLDGVRNGVDLAELLGARFERRLHDAGHADLIADVRRRVLDASGHEGRPARAIVDGLALAVAYAESTSNDPVRVALDQWRATLPSYPDDGLSGPLLATVADLDSTADLLTAQAVHSVIKGNLSEAGATLSAAGAGDAGIPQIRVADVHRPAQLVTHRLLAVLPRAKKAPPGSTLLATAEPVLASWLASLLPPPSEIAITVEFDDAAGSKWEATMAQLGLGAIDIVALASVDGQLATSLLGQLSTAWARAAVGVDRSVAARLSGSATQVVIIAGAARSVLGAARPLRGDDLSANTGLAHAIDVAELDARRLALASTLAELGASAVGVDVLAARGADLAALDPGGLLNALSSSERSDELVGELLRSATARADRLREPLPDDWSTLSPAARAGLLVTRMRASLGVSIPVLALNDLDPSQRAELSSSLNASAQRIGSPLSAMSWLLEAGRVHRGAGLCAELLDLVEVIQPRAPIFLQTAQLPHVAGEPWVAVTRPTSPGTRLNLVSVTDAATALAAGSVAGLVLDAWSEPIPGGQVTTGVAVHFDRPAAQPPQAVLLAMPPEEGDWSVNHIESLLLETLQLVTVRGVGPESLSRLGQTLPAVALASGAVVATVADLDGASRVSGVSP